MAKALNIYKNFHGVEPRRARQVRIESPEGPLMKLGTLSEIRYRPDSPSQHKGTEFYHESGDTGDRVLKSNLILATEANTQAIEKKKANRIRYESPKGNLMKLGSLSGIKFDNGKWIANSSYLLASDGSNLYLISTGGGRNLYLIKIDPNSRYPYVDERGIIG